MPYRATTFPGELVSYIVASRGQHRQGLQLFELRPVLGIYNTQSTTTFVWNGCVLKPLSVGPRRFRRSRYTSIYVTQVCGKVNHCNERHNEVYWLCRVMFYIILTISRCAAWNAQCCSRNKPFPKWRMWQDAYKGPRHACSVRTALVNAVRGHVSTFDTVG